MQTLALDLRAALRFLQRRAGTSAVIILTLALALAANSAAFAVLKSSLLSDLGVPGANRLHIISQTQKGAAFLDAWPNYQMLREQVKTFENVAAVLQADVNWMDGDETRQVSAARITASFFPTMRVTPRLGRAITANEQGPNPAPVVVISDRLWRSAFAGAPDAIGKVMRMNGVPHTIVGIMPEGFALPPDIEAWLPFDLPKDAWTRMVGARQLFVFGRLRDGRSNAEAQEELRAFGRRAEEASVANKDWSYASQPVRPYYVAAYGVTTTERLAYEASAVARLQMTLLSAFALVAVGVALLGSYGVMSQLVANRGRELAVRLAIGEDPGGVLRRVLGQNARLAGSGSVAGGVIAWEGGRFLQALVGGVDASAPWTYLLVVVLTVGLTQLGGLVPARRAAATNVLQALGGQ